MIELITVITIMGTLSVTAIGIFTGDSEYRLDAAATKITADIRYAQQLAMDNHDDYRITFNKTGSSYSLYNLDSPTTPITDPFSGSSFTVQLNTDIYAGVTITEATFGLSTYLDFDDEGNASSSGTITIAAGKLTRTISVLSTGLTRIELPKEVTVK